MLKGKKAVFFDMDGTLVDSVGIWNEVDHRLLEEMGVKEAREIDVQALRDAALSEFRSSNSPYEDYCAMLAERFRSQLSGAQLVDIRYRIAQELISTQVCYKPLVPQLLNILRAAGLTLAVVSTTKRDNMNIYRLKNENICNNAPIDEYFARIYTREDAAIIKPDPDIYLRALREMALEPGEVLVFEDSLVGVQAATAAGLETALIYDKYSDGDRAELERLAAYSFADWGEVIGAIEAEQFT